MMRRVLRFRPPKDSGWDAADYMAVSASKLQRYRAQRRARRWDESALLSAYTWAGHVARFSKYSPQRLALKALTFRDRSYLETLERLYGQQCHGRRFHVWRGEQQFTQQMGVGWKEYAMEGEVWEDNAEKWLMGRRHQM